MVTTATTSVLQPLLALDAGQVWFGLPRPGLREPWRGRPLVANAGALQRLKECTL